MLIIFISLVFFGLLPFAACAAPVIRLSMPVAPPPNEPSLSADELHYDSAATPLENLKRRDKILDQLRKTAARIANLKLANDAKSDLESVSPPHKLGSADRDSARSSLARELNSWKRVLESFDRESICGPLDNSQDVESYDGLGGPSRVFVDGHQSAVVQIQWVEDLAARLGPKIDPGNVAGVRWCTGTLIGVRMVLTAGHCFEVDGNGWRTPKRLANGVSLTSSQLAPLMQLNFNYQVDPATEKPRQSKVFPITRLLELGSDLPGKLDYAIIEVGPDLNGQFPAGSFSPAKVSLSKTTLMGAKLLTVIQHPNGLPKKVAAGVGIGISLPLLTYSDVDTLGGSSGSGVLDQGGNLVAVHTTGGCTDTGGQNRGVSLYSIGRSSKILK